MKIHLSFLGVVLYGLELDHDRFGEHPAFPYFCAVVHERGRFYLRLSVYLPLPGRLKLLT